ncbi:MAG: hypothetical protein F6K48_06320 [Okeania sp. SIO3H1]|nr:hypothetical protein [Okeania sp. SIO3H1]
MLKKSFGNGWVDSLRNSLISCPVEYLHFGRGKAEGTYAGGRRKEKVRREKVF